MAAMALKQGDATTAAQLIVPEAVKFATVRFINLAIHTIARQFTDAFMLIESVLELNESKFTKQPPSISQELVIHVTYHPNSFTNLTNYDQFRVGAID